MLIINVIIIQVRNLDIRFLLRIKFKFEHYPIRILFFKIQIFEKKLHNMFIIPIIFKLHVRVSHTKIRKKYLLFKRKSVLNQNPTSTSGSNPEVKNVLTISNKSFFNLKLMEFCTFLV